VTAATTFTDGAWYVARARPGRYRVTVAATSLAALAARAGPVEVVVPADGDAEVQAPTIQITLGRRAGGGGYRRRAARRLGHHRQPRREPCSCGAGARGCCSWRRRSRRAVRRIGASRKARNRSQRYRSGTGRSGTTPRFRPRRRASPPRCGASRCSSAEARDGTWPRIPTAPVSSRQLRNRGSGAGRGARRGSSWRRRREHAERATAPAAG